MKLSILTRPWVDRRLPRRDPWGHKGDFGKLLLICGSRGYTGAAALAARGALRAGAGLVYLGVPESIYAIEAVKLDEPVVFPLPDAEGRLAPAAIPALLDRASGCDGVLIGPGCGRSEALSELIARLLQQPGCPVVLDADGINVLAAHKDILRGSRRPVILTPHEGEFARLGYDPALGRQPMAELAARELGAVILLKGHRTLITDGTKTYVNQTGNAGMAVGGAGDVLAGVVTALLGQGLAPLEAAACAAWVHGAAGDDCAARLGQTGMLPTDLVEALPRQFRK